MKSALEIRYYNPHVLEFPYDGVRFEAEPDLEEGLREADCVVVVMDHSMYDWKEVYLLARCIVDTRHIIVNYAHV